MIDEYQDSNNVQETILRAVSKEAEGGHNMFMVGDVKQSIYRFRMARPELFIEKYETYTQEESENQRVDLHKNFRSRPEVLETVNDIFRKIMNQDIGNITYDAKAALYPGAAFPPFLGDAFLESEEKAGMFGTELLVIEPEEENKDLKTQELEAKAVGFQIQKMMQAQQVTEKMPEQDNPGTLRPVRYSDMVILLRSMTDWADTFVKVLGEMGIPAKAAAGSLTRVLTARTCMSAPTAGGTAVCWRVRASGKLPTRTAFASWTRGYARWTPSASPATRRKSPSLPKKTA